MDTAYKNAWISVIHIDKLTYIKAKINRNTLKDIQLIKYDILFAEINQYKI